MGCLPVIRGLSRGQGAARRTAPARSAGPERDQQLDELWRAGAESAATAWSGTISRTGRCESRAESGTGCAVLGGCGVISGSATDAVSRSVSGALSGCVSAGARLSRSRVSAGAAGAAAALLEAQGADWRNHSDRAGADVPARAAGSLLWTGV